MDLKISELKFSKNYVRKYGAVIPADRLQKIKIAVDAGLQLTILSDN